MGVAEPMLPLSHPWSSGRGRRRRRGPGHAGWYLLALACLAALVWAADRLLQPDAYPVRRVSFEGPFRYVSPRQLEAAVQGAVGGNYFSVDLDALEAAVKRIPWVDQVTIRREWPQSLHLRYTEHRLVARWGRGRWLSAAGRVLALPEHAAARHLPLLRGPRGSGPRVLAAYRRMRAVLAPGGLELERLELSARGAWRAGLRAGPRRFTAFLGSEAPRARLRRLARAFRALPPRAIRYVDLRYPNGFAVAWAGGPAEGGS